MAITDIISWSENHRGLRVLALIFALLLVAVASHTFSPWAHAQTVTIDFDSIDTSQTGVASVSDEFQSQGVIFSSFNPTTGATGPATVVKDGLFGNGATSLPNSVAFGFQGTAGIATFVDPVSGAAAVTDFVSAQVGDRSGEPDPITMTAFAANGDLLGSSFFNSLTTGDFGLVSISAPGIHQVEFTDASPSGADFDDFTFNEPTTLVIQVPIDIKPGSFPNSINLGSKGTLPVAILSTASFDPTTVDPSTVTVAAAPVKTRGKKNTPMAAAEDVNGDGLLDLVVHVATADLQLSKGDTEATLEGETFDGTAIMGTDSVRFVP